MSELTLSRVWQEGLYASTMRSTDGRRVQVVYRGVWTYSNGPDFRDAMIDIDGRLRRGSVELHVRASDWDIHGHSSDPSYDDVVLHVVLNDDRDGPVVTNSGLAIPTVDLTSFLSQTLDAVERQIVATVLGDTGGRPCLPTVATSYPDEVRSILRREGWKRLAGKQLRFQQELERFPPGEVLYRGILDGLGLMQNRGGMAAVAEIVPLSLLESPPVCRYRMMWMLLGAGGFLPLTPSHAALAELEPPDVAAIEEYDVDAVRASRGPAWNLNRVRPANHPVRRLASMADLVNRSAGSGLLGALTAVPLDRPTCWREWLEMVRPAIGRSRADQVSVNVFAPFLAAYAEVSGDRDLADRVAAHWERLPGAADDSIAKGTLRQIVGDARFPVRAAIESQGLHRIGRDGCAVLRCFECPVAHLAARLEPLEPGLREES